MSFRIEPPAFPREESRCIWIHLWSYLHTSKMSGTPFQSALGYHVHNKMDAAITTPSGGYGLSWEVRAHHDLRKFIEEWGIDLKSSRFQDKNFNSLCLILCSAVLYKGSTLWIIWSLRYFYKWFQLLFLWKREICVIMIFFMSLNKRKQRKRTAVM